MQLKAPYIFNIRGVRRPTKKRGEVLDGADVAFLGAGRQLADRHVFDHATAQRADRLVGHGDAPV